MNIQNCWVCDKKLELVSDEEYEKIPFHCSQECQDKCQYWNYKPISEDLKDEPEQSIPEKDGGTKSKAAKEISFDYAPFFK